MWPSKNGFANDLSWYFSSTVTGIPKFVPEDHFLFVADTFVSTNTQYYKDKRYSGTNVDVYRCTWVPYYMDEK